MRDLPFSYACAGCGRCCFEKRIVVNPYEIARIAAARNTSTTEVLEKHTVEGGTVLKQREDGGCSFLEGKGCGVHAGRPLVCRLYPLGRIVEKEENERFVRLRGHPESEGVFGEAGTIGQFLENQQAEAYMQASAKYFALFTRLVKVLSARPDGSDTFRQVVKDGVPEESIEWLDVDATLARRAKGPIPDDVEARVALHLRLLEDEIASMERSP